MLVSCLLVTGCSASRERFGLAAVRSFRKQTYGPRELVIINQSFGTAHEYRLLSKPDERGPAYTIRELLVSRAATLGEARNLSLEAATGDWWLPWDDDDWSHPQRLEWQLGNRRGNSPVVPTRYTVYSFVTNSAYVSRRKLCPGLALFPRTAMRYPAEARSEDMHFLKQFDTNIRWQNPPQMYLRFHHGDNTWGAKHILGKYAQPVMHGRWQVPAPVAKYLKHILTKEYLKVV